MRHFRPSSLCIVHSALCIAFAALCAASASADEYVYRVPISVSGYTGNSTLANFPVLVRLSEGSPSGFSYADCAADGSDIRFADANGVRIPHEIDTWNPSGESCVWVKLPSMAKGTRFEMHYGGNPSSVNTPTGVWADYIGVWHFSETSGGDALDASGHGLHAVERAGAASELAAESKVGGARLVTAANVTKTQALTVPDFIPTYGGGTVFSASGWFKFPGCTGNAYYCIIDKKRTTGAGWSATSGWYLEMNNSPTKISLMASNGQIPTANITSTASNWHYFTVVSTGSNYRLFLDGAMIIDTSNPVNVSTCPMELMPFPGGIADEFRFRTTAVDADWALADYKAQTGTLLTYGSSTTANYIDVTATPEAFGSPSPAYGAISAVSGQTYTFTAPASGYNANGAKSATCTGWNLYREGEATPFRTSSDAGETTLSCTLQYSEPVRLEWTWGNAVVHGWRYDGSGSTKLITEIDPPGGGDPWIITCTPSGFNLTLTGVQQVGTNAVLNLRLPVTDANDAEYAIIAVGANAFKQENAIEDLLLPDTVTSLGNAAFQQCLYIEHVRLPAALKTMGNDVFSGCQRIRTIEPFLPETITSLGTSVFENCWRLVSPLSVGYGTDGLGAPIAVSLGGRDFFACKLLPSMSFGPGVTSIPVNFAYGCYNPDQDTGLTHVTLHHGVTAIGGSAFDQCKALESVEPLLPASLTSLGNSVFSGDARLAGTAFVGTNVVCSLGDSAFRNTGISGVVFGSGAGATVPQYFCYNCDNLASIVFNDGMTRIGASAFYDCDALPSVQLPSALERIDSNAFDNCDNLETVTPLLPATVTTVGKGAFINSPKLRGDLVIAPGGEPATVGEGAFGSSAGTTAPKITSVFLGDGITRIESRTFYGGSAITNVHLPANLEYIGANAFDVCRSLVRMEPFLPDSVTNVASTAFSSCVALRGDLRIAAGGAPATIGEYAFQYCSKLDSVFIGDGVSTIPQKAFLQCRAITNLHLSATLTAIGNNAFDDCDALRTVNPFLPATLTSLGKQAFSGCDLLETPCVIDGGASPVTVGESALNWCGPFHRFPSART